MPEHEQSALAVTLSDWSGSIGPPTPITGLAAPLLSVSLPGGRALGSGSWVSRGPALLVERADTELVEHGPVRITVRQRLGFVGGHTYTTTLTLGARQDAALIAEETTVDAPKTAFCFSMRPGLEADRVLWHNQWRKTENAGVWSRVLSNPAFEEEERVCQLRPWSFWWLGDITEWVGFYRKGGDAFVGVLALRPSHWSPTGWRASTGPRSR